MAAFSTPVDEAGTLKIAYEISYFSRHSILRSHNVKDKLHGVDTKSIARNAEAVK